MTGVRESRDGPILVTGAQGFVGRYVVAELLRRGDRVVVGVGRSPRLPRTFTHEVSFGDRQLPAPLPATILGALQSESYFYERVDLQDRPRLTRLLQEVQPTAVVHLATSRTHQAVGHLFQANVGAAEGLLESIVGAGIVPRIVFASSGGVYGRPLEEGRPASEEDSCAPLDPCGMSLRATEQIGRFLADRHHLSFVIARIFNVLGVGQHERHVCGRAAAGVAAIHKGLRPPELQMGPLDSSRDFSSVEQVSMALVRLAEASEEGVFNVASGIERPVRAVVFQLLELAGLLDSTVVRETPERLEDIDRLSASTERLARLGVRWHDDVVPTLRKMIDYYTELVAPDAGSAAPNAGEDSPLQVRVHETHDYEVRVEAGVRKEVPALLARRFPSAKLVVITDETVYELHGRELLQGFRAAGAAPEVVVLPAGEPTKALAPFPGLIQQMRERGFDRRALLVCLGGGLVTDVGGFLAATYMRGVAYVNVPTTLLAQHDSAIGGKVAVNTPWAKNFVGAFHHPRGVFSDPEVLGTLPDRDISAGVAEAIKVALCTDPELFGLLEEHVDAIRRQRDASVLTRVIRRASRGKIDLLDPDPYEVDLRRVLNLGHTFGHPLEVELAYQDLPHGEAVGFGIAVATAIAHARGVCDDGTRARIFRLLAAYGLPPRVPRTRLDRVCDRLDEIRLVRANALHFVLPERLGRVSIVPEIADREFAIALDSIAADLVLGSCIEP
jgi:3-dehydroquinate synthase